MKESDREKLGQLFVVGIQGNKLSTKTKSFLKTIQPGGIIIFEENVKDKKQLKELISQIKKLIKIKPFISVDQEGGSVERLRKICTSVPSLWGLNKTNIKELVTIQELIAKELRELGFNMNFAPVLDINSNPKNPIIGNRAISNLPKEVSYAGSKIIKAFLKHNIIPVAKHFPGHGDLCIDSHIGLPTLKKSKIAINKFEVIPFKMAIKQNIPAIMIGHIYIPAFDSTNNLPASLSKNIIWNYLRKELKFKGLIITDELNMKGITKFFTLEKASLEAIKAGTDLLLFNTDEKSTMKTYNFLLKKIKFDQHFKDRVKKSYFNIQKSKTAFLALRNKLYSKQKDSLQNKEISSRITSKIVTWINKDLYFEFKKKGEPVEVFFPTTHRLRKEDLNKILQELNFEKVTFQRYEINPTNKEISTIMKKSSNKSSKIFITYDMAARNGQQLLAKKILTLYPKTIFIGVGLEYDIKVIPKIKNYICAYGTNYISLKTAFSKI